MIRSRIARRFSILCLFLASAAHGAEPVALDAGSRWVLDLTLYQQGFGLVREIRGVDGLGGTVDLVWRDVPRDLDAESVLLRPAPGTRGSLTFLSQQFLEGERPTPGAVLERWQGRPVLHHMGGESGEVDRRMATLLDPSGPVLEIDGRVVVAPPGWLSLPEMPEGLGADPALRWSLRVEGGPGSLELAYLSSSFAWGAHHILLLGPGWERGDLLSRARVENRSEVDFTGARVELIAGSVRRARGAPVAFERMAAAPMAIEEAQERSFADYHLYTLPAPVDLPAASSKLLGLQQLEGLRVERGYLLTGQPHLYRSMRRDGGETPEVAVILEVATDEGGRPLPAGAVQVYREEADSARRFVGEGTIGHTPAGESFEIQIGSAFDIVAERRQTDYQQQGRCASQSSWEVVLRNRKVEAVTVEVREPVGADWEVVAESRPHRKLDAGTLAFDVPVPAGGEVTLTWTVRVRWC